MKSQLANDVAAHNLVSRLTKISQIFRTINMTFIDKGLNDMARLGEMNALDGIDDLAVACKIPRAHRVGRPTLRAVR